MNHANPEDNLPESLPAQSEETELLLSASNESTAKPHGRPRRWVVIYVCTVALQCFFILGFAVGFTSPVLSKLGDRQEGYSSLRKTSDQDIFSVGN